jgi:hypothetical protein
LGFGSKNIKNRPLTSDLLENGHFWGFYQFFAKIDKIVKNGQKGHTLKGKSPL